MGKFERIFLWTVIVGLYGLVFGMFYDITEMFYDITELREIDMLIDKRFDANEDLQVQMITRGIEVEGYIAKLYENEAYNGTLNVDPHDFGEATKQMQKEWAELVKERE